MCAPSVPDTPATPPEPETVKRLDADVIKARNDAKSAAAEKHGIVGTNVTKGGALMSDDNTKRKTLGGE